MTPIPPVAPAKRAALDAALKALGRRPTTTEATAIAAQVGVGRTTVYRAWERLAPAQQPHTEPTAQGKTTLKESVSPVLDPAAPRHAKAKPKAEEPHVYACDSCGCEWTLEPGEAQPNTCPGCQEPFA